MHDPRIDAWWETYGSRFTPAAPEVSLAVEALPDALRAALPAELRAAVAVPPELTALLERTGGLARASEDGWDVLFSSERIANELAYAVGLHDLAMIRTGGIWAQFAQSGDRSCYFISCEAGSPAFGLVIEGYDDHPWLENGLLRGLGTEPVSLDDAKPLVEWLAWWTRDRDDPA